MATTSRIPITVLNGFTGSGKTTLLLNTLPQLRQHSSTYKLAMIKNEIGDVAVDSALAAAAELAGTQELLGDCICCTNVGQIESALLELKESCSPDRIVIETSGSAEPLKLVLEVNRIAKATGLFQLDGVVSVVDAENWGGYASTSFTAKLQAQQTDLIVINKWESLGEREYDTFLDRLGDLDVDTPQVKSDQGWVAVDLLFGLDSKLAKGLEGSEHRHDHDHDHKHGHGHSHGDHKSEIECVSVTLTSSDENAGVDLRKLSALLKTAPKDEVFRIKAILYSNEPPEPTNGAEVNGTSGRRRYILNWSFGRWTWASDDGSEPSAPVVRMSIFTAQYESNKWIKRIESGDFVALAGTDASRGELQVKRVQ